MENKPKKSKALIITIIIIVLLLLAALFFIFQNRSSSDVKTSSGLAKIFSSLIPSKNTTGLKTIAQAGEDINKGDCVSVFGTGADNNPIVVKITCGKDSFGTANENITSGNSGEIITNSNTGSSNFWNSISDFLGGIFGKNTNPINNPTEEGEGVNVEETIYPTVAVTATPSSIAKEGSSTITWTSSNAKECALSGGGLNETGIENKTGVPTGALTTSTSYNVTCTGENGLKGSDNVFVAVEGSKIPDLVADRVTPESAVVNTQVTLSSVIRNMGNGSTNTDFSGYFNINSVDDNYTKSFTAINISPLTSDDSKVVTIPFTFRAPGTYSITVCADQFSPTNNKGSITEANENNNCSDSINFEVTEERGGGTDGEINPSLLPKITVTATPSTIPDGGISTISWTSENTNDCDAGSPDRGTGTSGSFKTDRLGATTSFTVTCTASRINGTASGNVVVYVEGDPNSDKTPTVTVTANPTSVTTTADGSTINWTSTNATKCNADNLSRGTGETGNFPTGRLMKTTMYTVICTGLHGSSSASVIVYVDGNPNGGTPDLISSSIIPTSVIINTPTNLSSIITNRGNGGTVDSFSVFFTINKNNANKDSITKLTTTVPAIESGLGDVAVISYTFDTNGEYLVRACADKSSVTDNGKISESNENNNCGVETIVTVSKPIPSPNDSLLPKVTVTATPSTIPDGGISTISWTSENTNDCDAGSPDRGTGTSGSFKTDRLGATTSFTVTCTASRTSGTASGSVTVYINKDPNSGNETPNKCLLIEQNPLTFTQEEKARLAVLLRKFYLISSTLKTADDITTIYNEIDQQKNFVTQVEELTTQCYSQIGPKGAVSTKMNNNGWVRHGNPWYSEGTTGSFPYSIETGIKDNGYLIPVNGDTQDSATERILNIW